ncbi:MAG: Verru_Chthon cassette protein A [Terrimicrobiaceae bacterium]
MIRPPRRNSATALVLVLIFLVAITFVVLVVAANSLAERRASTVVDTTLNTELLVSTVENLVQTQIRAATTLPASQAWVSQPGMIRVYSQDGTLTNAYKLYSGQDLQVSGGNFTASLAKDIQLAATMDFTNKPALYVDLNQPAIFQSEVHYPIADPRALGKVDGFLYNTSTNAPTKTYNTTGASTTVPVIPMPVAWMYVLSDGQIIAPATSGSAVELPDSSATNPVVGRIAFWVDDETCKLNINTAADGSYWDTPRAGAFGSQPLSNPTQSEMKLALYQPAQNEFQRYPGHPATTSLTPVLGYYLSQLDSSLSNPDTMREKLIALSPRYVPGGSTGGSIAYSGNGTLGAKDQRFYESVDEYYFDPSRGVRSVAGASALSSALEQTRFFLSGSSRAPEVNLYNMPRVSLWPVNSQSGTGFRTVNDQLDLFCSSLGTSGSNIYAFMRSNPSAVNGELTGRNLILFNYLNTLVTLPFPGFGPTSFSQKYPLDSEQIVTQSVDFIRCTNLVDQSMPTPSTFSPFTTTLKIKNAAGDIDYLNSRGTGQVVPMSNGASRGFGRFPTISEAAIIVVGEKLNQTTTSNTTTAAYQARAVLALELTSVAQGAGVIIPNLQIQVEGLDGITMSLDGGTTYNPIGFNSPVTHIQGEVNGYALFGGTMGLASQKQPASTTSPMGTPPAVFISAPFAPDSTTDDFANIRLKKFSFRQTKPIVVKLLNNNGEQVQRFTFSFPDFTSNFPAPLLSASNTDLSAASILKTGTNIYQTPFFGSNNSTLDQRKQYDSFPRIFPINDDVVKSLVPMGPMPTGGTSVQGDIRLVAALEDVPSTVFVKNVNYDTQSNGGASHSLSSNCGAFGRQYNDGRFGRLVKDVNLNLKQNGLTGTIDYGPPLGVQTINYDNGLRAQPEVVALCDIPQAVNGVVNSLGKPGDFDTGISYLADGPWINKPDDGDIKTTVGTRAAYFVGSQAQMANAALFSPNRQVASAVQLGSLPTGVKAGNPWQTLLFCPNPAAVTTDAEAFSSAVHAGFGSPGDHLLLDLFWMPVVEPWAVSDPLSTAGKVNLNQQMLPFVNITRDAALRGVLKNVKIPALPFAEAYAYKWLWAQPANKNYRYDVDQDKTVAEIAKKAVNNGVYLSASEICNVFLIPKAGTGNPVAIPANLTGSNIISSFWTANRLTGDNLRERPYAVLYPRLTTKSNVFTVHYTVQSLKKTPSSAVGYWDESRDLVLGEQRGAITLERYVDSKDPEFDLPAYDFAARISDANPPTLGRFYKFRTIATRQFRP